MPVLAFWCGTNPKSDIMHHRIVCMVRYSVTMQDDLVKKIDTICDSVGMSRSEWLNELCMKLLDGNGVSGSGVQAAVSVGSRPRPARGTI
jgi:acetyl-CoA synthetase